MGEREISHCRDLHPTSHVQLVRLHDKVLLIQPTGVNGDEHGDQRGPLTLKPLDRLGPAVARAVVQNPEHALRRPIRLLRHHLGDQTVNGAMPAGGSSTKRARR